MAWFLIVHSVSNLQNLNIVHWTGRGKAKERREINQNISLYLCQQQMIEATVNLMMLNVTWVVSLCWDVFFSLSLPERGRRKKFSVHYEEERREIKCWKEARIAKVLMQERGRTKLRKRNDDYGTQWLFCSAYQ